MTVKQCDRCGNICKERGKGSKIPEFDNIILSVRLPNNRFTGNKIILDLCPECQELLWKWITEEGFDPTKKGV